MRRIVIAPMSAGPAILFRLLGRIGAEVPIARLGIWLAHGAMLEPSGLKA